MRIRSAVRVTPILDRYARAELTAILEDLAPLMNPAWPVAP
jgi:hypothetical protein